MNSRELVCSGSIVVGYYDIRHAVYAYKTMKAQLVAGYRVQASFLYRNNSLSIADSYSDSPSVAENEGEIIISYQPPNSKDSRAVLKDILPKFGSIRSLTTDVAGIALCEYHDIRHAATALDWLDGKLLKGVQFKVAYKSSDSQDTYLSANKPKNSFLLSSSRHAFSAHAPPFERKNIHDRTYLYRSEPQPTVPVYSGHESLESDSVSFNSSSDYNFPSSNHSAERRSSQSTNSSLFNSRRSSLLNFQRPSDEWDAEACLTFQVENFSDTSSRKYNVYTSANVPKNNVVDLERIARGLDTRTTLMLRNIPNKVDQQMLKEYIDVTNKNTYDFLYLRIDFLNKCNVGYAFISFTSPDAIIVFAKARAGTKWNRFNSEKICDISYANIQGKECLIEKFRNSSVMDQDEAYRPKIYYSDGPRKGEEEEFPPPNNLNRKLRSIASIQQIGLFPPGSNGGSWRRVPRY
ncbi:RNA recognition motif 2-domain-containing protein [Lipomyces oligophaga]|uniref:RNA recognition motif 2-domain-containing protein n=1 Tax=Lipomyces oligophaga TaxID=45792 RepID=UPI0034CDC816